MNFEQALFELSLKEELEKKTPANITIRFDSKEYGKGHATLKAPRYHKEKSDTMDCVKRAWECFCNGSEDKLYSITGIEIEYEDNTDGRKENKRLSA